LIDSPPVEPAQAIFVVLLASVSSHASSTFPDFTSSTNVRFIALLILGMACRAKRRGQTIVLLHPLALPFVLVRGLDAVGTAQYAVVQ
jgi:predicted Na+-dependent transporter